jgi:hypothetical protein
VPVRLLKSKLVAHPVGKWDVAAKEQDQRSFFLRLYGKLFVLTVCVAQNVPSKTGRCRIAHAHSWHVHTRNKVEWCSRLIQRR